MKTIKSIVLALAFATLACEVSAQGVKIPAPSSGQTINQDFGLGKITLVYSRPNTKGRKVFGALEPYDKVWRTGANSATSITFTDAVKIEDQDLPAGTYGLFTIPNKTEWTIIFSKNPKQWGAYTYDQKDDVIRVKVKPVTLKDKVETMTIQFANVYETKGQLQIVWENTLVPVNFSTDIDSRVMASIDEAMKGDKKPYMQSAIYYYSNDKDIKKAVEWMTEAEKQDGKAPWVKLWKGRCQLKAGDKAGALASAKAGLELAKEVKNEEYIKLNTELIAQAQK